MSKNKTKKTAKPSITKATAMPPWCKVPKKLTFEEQVAVASIAIECGPAAEEKESLDWLTYPDNAHYFDSDCFVEEKKSKKSTEPKKDPETRISVFGNIYPITPECHWKEVEGVGWVHVEERYQFREVYFKCAVSGKFSNRSRRSHAIHGGKEVLVCAEEAKKLGMICCEYTGRLVHPDETFDACNGEGEKIKVSKFYQTAFIKCDFSGQLFPGSFTIHISGSSKFKRVGVPHIEKNFSKCDHCSQYFEKTEVKYRTEFGSNLCELDYVKLQLSESIGPYNDKHFPKPIKVSKFRRGAKLGPDGLYYATHTRDEEIVDLSALRKFGVEIETELHKPALVKLGMTRFHLAVEIKKALGQDFVHVKEDGTLTLNGKYDGNSEYDPEGTKNGPMYAGFEIVSGPNHIDIHRERWPMLDKAESLHDKRGNRLLRAWDTETCGMHVHVSRGPLTNLQIGRILYFVNHPANRAFIYKISGRPNWKFCWYDNRALVDVLHPERVISPKEPKPYDRNRRVAVNIRNPSTIEFRIFRGTIHPRHIIRNLEFCDAVCDFAYPCSRGFAELANYRHFIRFVDSNRKTWPLLAEWLAHQKMIAMKKASEGADISKFTIRPELVVEPLHESVAKIEDDNIEVSA